MAMTEEVNPYKLLNDLNYGASKYMGPNSDSSNAPFFVDVGYGRITVQQWLDHDTGSAQRTGDIYLMAESGKCAPLWTNPGI